jgi:hypothetical protein
VTAPPTGPSPIMQERRKREDAAAWDAFAVAALTGYASSGRFYSDRPGAAARQIAALVGELMNERELAKRGRR